jgi:exoribonuclease R
MKTKLENNLIKGKIQGNSKGFGFLIPEDGQPDLFIAPRNLRGAYNGDTVLVKKLNSRLKSEGEVIKIIERKTDRLVGIFRPENGFGFVLPDDKKYGSDIYVHQKNTLGAKSNDKVVVKILSYPKDRKNPEGKIVEVLGQSGEKGVDLISIARKYNLKEEFDEAVLKEAESVPQAVCAADVAGRLDLRGEVVFTIDGEDAKDLDDAVSITKNAAGGYTLGVHIADVTHYVREGSKLDVEAAARATSVYLPDMVLPMLPRPLSNGICSLNPKVDRLTLSCIMELDAGGSVTGHKIVKSIIKTTERLTYDEVSAFLDAESEGGDAGGEGGTAFDNGERNGKTGSTATAGAIAADATVPATATVAPTTAAAVGKSAAVDNAAAPKTAITSTAAPAQNGKLRHIKKELLLMRRLAQILIERQVKRGSIDFDIPEAKIITDENGKTTDIIKAPRCISHRIIEMFMILANETVAEHIFRAKLPFVYRVHEKPSVEKMTDFIAFAALLGFKIDKKPEDVHPKIFSDLLIKLDGSPVQGILNKVMLRSMQKAVYSDQNLGHFGLASKFYCHFTSPIRRYPDLTVHRVIKLMLSGRQDEKRLQRLAGEVGEIAKNSSLRERAAEEAERDADDMKKAEYMQSRIGGEFDAVISGVTGFGIFAELSNTIEGLIRASFFSKDFNYNEKQYLATTGGKTYRLGDKIRVQCVGADVESRRIDFVLTEDGA